MKVVKPIGLLKALRKIDKFANEPDNFDVNACAIYWRERQELIDRGLINPEPLYRTRIDCPGCGSKTIVGYDTLTPAGRAALEEEVEK